MSDLDSDDNGNGSIVRQVRRRRIGLYNRLQAASQSSVTDGGDQEADDDETEGEKPRLITVDMDSQWRLWVEWVLIISPVLWNLGVGLDRDQVLTSCMVLTSIVYYRHFTSHQMLYSLLFSILLSPPTLLPLNLALATANLPLAPVLHKLCTLLIQRDLSKLMATDIYRTLQTILTQVCSTSLTPVESKLFAQLLVNIIYSDTTTTTNDKFFPIFIKFIFICPMIALIPCLHWIDKIIALTKIIGKHKRPINYNNLKLQYSITIAVIFICTTIMLLHCTLEYNHTSILQLLRYIFRTSHCVLLGYWLILLVISVPLVMLSSSSWSLDLRRKVWHLLSCGHVYSVTTIRQRFYCAFNEYSNSFVFDCRSHTCYYNPAIWSVHPQCINAVYRLSR